MSAPDVPQLAVALLGLLAVPARPQEALAIIEPAAPGQGYGDTVAFVGDQDGDGVSEFAVAEHFSDRVTVHDGRFGDVRHQLSYPDGFGADVAGGDVDGDGLADLAASAWAVDNVRLFSGLDGKHLKTFLKVSKVLDFVGDVDGDGLDDLVGGDSYFADGD